MRSAPLRRALRWLTTCLLASTCPLAFAEPRLPMPAAAAACSLLVPRLPSVSYATCAAARLEESGAFSRNGVPLYWRDVTSQAPGGAAQADPLRVLVLGAIHGDELTAGALALRWIALAGKTPHAVHWRFVPVVNPDGLLAKKPQRTNARGVDLNRNFRTPGWDHDAPLHWQMRAHKDPRRWPGPSSLSEPETRFLDSQIESYKPQLVVSIHAPYGVLDFDGPMTPPRQLGALRLEQVGVFPGSLGYFGGLKKGLPVVTIELPNALRMPKELEQRDMWTDLLRWMDAHLLADVREAHEKPEADKLSVH